MCESTNCTPVVYAVCDISFRYYVLLTKYSKESKIHLEKLKVVKSQYNKLNNCDFNNKDSIYQYKRNAIIRSI